MQQEARREVGISSRISQEAHPVRSETLDVDSIGNEARDRWPDIPVGIEEGGACGHEGGCKETERERLLGPVGLGATASDLTEARRRSVPTKGRLDQHGASSTRWRCGPPRGASVCQLQSRREADERDREQVDSGPGLARPRGEGHRVGEEKEGEDRQRGESDSGPGGEPLAALGPTPRSTSRPAAAPARSMPATADGARTRAAARAIVTMAARRRAAQIAPGRTGRRKSKARRFSVRSRVKIEPPSRRASTAAQARAAVRPAAPRSSASGTCVPGR